MEFQSLRGFEEEEAIRGVEARFLTAIIAIVKLRNCVVDNCFRSLSFKSRPILLSTTCASYFLRALVKL